MLKLPGFPNSIWFLTLLLSFNYSCQIIDEDKSLSEEEALKISFEVETMLRNYYRDVAINGIGSEFNYLDTAYNFYWIPPGYSTWISYDSVETVIKKSSPNIKTIENHWESLRVDPISNNYASYSGVIRGKTTGKDGNILEQRFLESGLVVKREEGWKLLRGQTRLIK